MFFSFGVCHTSKGKKYFLEFLSNEKEERHYHINEHI